MPAAHAQPACQTLIDQIAYCSLASPSVRSLGFLAQLQSAPSGTTGLLLWEGRLLIHWLEAPAEKIEALWAQVQSDAQQHCVVRLLYRRAAQQRLFADWQMRESTRQDMMVVVREMKEISGRETDAQALQWQHAISTLSILLDPDLTRFYAQSGSPAHAAALPAKALA